MCPISVNKTVVTLEKLRSYQHVHMGTNSNKITVSVLYDQAVVVYLVNEVKGQIIPDF